MGVVLDPLAAAGNGFLVVLQDTRGRFASEGEREPRNGPCRWLRTPTSTCAPTDA
ncbi:CocE/NonD family hydrolase [Streptomyces sp. NBC_00019]|uniref:CocE/NonD family hydrolase n=1 Tax=Streptomyces sp. NBC_00019 TaxID=2975623 RepID=UPI0032470691